VSQTKQCDMNSNNIKLTQKFCKNAIQACQQADIFTRIYTLTACDKLTNQDHADLETIDAELTSIQTQANQQCIKQGNHPWSPALHTAYLVHHYWTQKSQKHMGRNYPHTFVHNEQKTLHEQLHPALSTSILANLQAAQTALHQIHQDALAI